MAIGKILELSDKISGGENIEVDFEKNQKNVKSKKYFQKKICIAVWLKKYFFSKTKDEIDYIKCYKTISMPFLDIISFLNSYNVILDYIHY